MIDYESALSPRVRGIAPSGIRKFFDLLENMDSSDAISLGVGVYDGFYGPGTGTFLIILFSLLAKLDVRSANGLCKAVNLTTNVTSLVVFLRGGQVLIVLGLAAAACNMIGNWLGSGMAIKSGVKITRPIILLVLALLLLKVLGVLG